MRYTDAMRIRRSTLDVLEREPGLYEVVLSRMQGVLGDEPERPAEVCRSIGLSYGGLLAWVNGDEGRQRRFSEALRVRAQLLAEEAVGIADGLDPVTAVSDDDASQGDVVARDALRVKTRLALAAAWDRGRYGRETRKVEVTIDLGERLRRAEERERVVGSGIAGSADAAPVDTAPERLAHVLEPAVAVEAPPG